MVAVNRLYHTVFSCGTLILLPVGLCLLQTVECRKRGLRRGNNQYGSQRRRSTSYFDELTCRLSLFEFIDDENDPKGRHVYMCSPLIDGKVGDKEYELVELDDDLREEHRKTMKDGLETFVTITGVWIDEKSAHIILSSNSEFKLSENHRTLRRKLTPKEGTIKALVVRIIMNDREPCYGNSELFQITFVERVSLRGQYQACSFGKLKIEPTSIGVLDVRVNQDSTRTSNKAAVNEATDVALAKVNDQTSGDYTSLTEYADMILFVTPQIGEYLAYASVGGGVSVYNDKWGGFVASVMHETGHNLQLLHAFEGEEYLDYTGYMGGAIIGYHDEIGFPRECYNAENHWNLGWFSDRSIETDLYTPTLIKVAAFADYDKTTAGQEYVIVQTGNIYMQYNRAKGINEDTFEYQDHLVLYQGVTEGSFLFANLQYPDKPLYSRTFPQGNFHVEICDQVFGDDRNTPDYLLVSIGFGDSLCSPVSSSSELSSSNDGRDDDDRDDDDFDDDYYYDDDDQS